jgi:hypothetical protein
MTAARTYKQPTNTWTARAELARCAGTHFDPQVVRAFLGISLPRLLAAMGPVALLVHLPFLRSLEAAGSQVGTAVATGASATAIAVGFAVVPATPAAPAPGSAVHRHDGAPSTVTPGLRAGNVGRMPLAGRTGQTPGLGATPDAEPAPRPDSGWIPVPAVTPDPADPSGPLPPGGSPLPLPGKPLPRPSDLPRLPPPTLPLPTKLPLPTELPLPTKLPPTRLPLPTELRLPKVPLPKVPLPTLPEIALPTVPKPPSAPPRLPRPLR